MLKYIGKRILIMIPVLLGVIIFVFTIMYLTPGNPARIMLGPTASEEAVQQLLEEKGFDRPYRSSLIIKILSARTGESFRLESGAGKRNPGALSNDAEISDVKRDSFSCIWAHVWDYFGDKTVLDFGQGHDFFCASRCFDAELLGGADGDHSFLFHIRLATGIWVVRMEILDSAAARSGIAFQHRLRMTRSSRGVIRQDYIRTARQDDREQSHYHSRLRNA